jgi:hypothetical protein
MTALGAQSRSGTPIRTGSILEVHGRVIGYPADRLEEVMENITGVLTASDEQLLEAAEATTVDFSDAVETPSIVLGEPCDI